MNKKEDCRAYEKGVKCVGPLTKSTASSFEEMTLSIHVLQCLESSFNQGTLALFASPVNIQT